jgi:uncharacterized protein YegP (UPF0339 family)
VSQTVWQEAAMTEWEYKAEVYEREDGLWDWRVKARNGEIIATSGGQGFTDQGDALRSLATVKELIGQATDEADEE